MSGRLEIPVILSGFLWEGKSWVSERVGGGESWDEAHNAFWEEDIGRVQGGLVVQGSVKRATALNGKRRGGRNILKLFIFLLQKILYYCIPTALFGIDIDKHHRPTITNEPSLATTSPNIRFLPLNPTRFWTRISDGR